VEDDEGVWSAQRAAQRSGEHAVVRVVARPTSLAGILQACADCGARAVGRAALGISFITVEDGELEALLSRLPAEASWMLFDGPERVRARLEDWTSDVAPATLELMRRVKQRFDPTRTCNPGLLVGGI